MSSDGSPDPSSFSPAAASGRVDSSAVLVSEDLRTPGPSPPSFAAAAPSRLPLLGAVALLVHVLKLVTGDLELTIAQMSLPVYEGSVGYICAVIDSGEIATEIPDVPPECYAKLRKAAEQQLRTYARPPGAGSPASPGGVSLLASDLVGAPRPDKRWAFNGTTCSRLGHGKISVLFWLDSLQSALIGEAGIQDGKIQGQHLRQLVEGPVLDQLIRKIEELPELRTAIALGTVTFADYAAALISCADPDETLACHYAATHPRRLTGEKLSDAAARTELAFRAAAAHGCKPGEAGRFWAVFGLLTSAERSTYTGRPGVRARLQRPLRESEGDAAARHAGLLTDLLGWAKAQSTAGTPRPGPPRAADTPAAAPGGTSRRRRRGSTATAAAALAASDGSSAPNSSSEDEAADPVPPATATAAPAAAAASPRGPRALAVFYYTGDRDRDAAETARRRASGECLKCLPGGRIHACPCPLHPSNPLDSSAPRCFPYRA